MLSELRSENFRGFDQHTISFEKLNIIVGSNNAGKSSVVEALRIISFTANRYKNLTYRKIPDWLDMHIGGINYGVTPSLKNAEINFSTIYNQYNDDKPAIIQAIFNDNAMITTYLNNEGGIHSVIRNNQGRVISSKSDASKLNLPSINILPQVGPLEVEEFTLEPEYIKNSIGSSLSPLHFRNQLKIFYNLFPQFKKMVFETWTGVMVQALLEDVRIPKSLLSLQVRNEKFVAEVSAMGHGLQMWLQVIWFLTLFSESRIIILDEPDVYMHADLQKKLIRMIKAKFPQVILTTHSIEIMSEVEPENILIIDKNSTKSQFANKIPAVQRLINSTGSIQNINLTRLSKAKKFLIVEGEDLKYLKVLQNKIFPRSSYPIDLIPNMSIGGWSGWNYAIGSSMLLTNSLEEKLLIYCILDSDYHTLEEIENRIKEAKEKSIELHILKKKEIENYFIIPSAVKRLIYERTKRKYSVTIEEVESKLLSISAALKEEVTDCFANEIFLKNRNLGLQYANRKAREYVNEFQAKYNNMLDLISGKEIITRLSCWTQQNYEISLSPMGLLNELTKSEIDQELSSFINCIEFNIRL